MIKLTTPRIKLPYNELTKRDISTINEIIIHCSAADTPQTVTTIDRVHRKKGFHCIGYHFIIDKKGTIFKGRPVDYIGAHCKGHNKRSIGICLMGLNKMTPRQGEALRWLISSIRMEMLFISSHGGISVIPHRYYNPDKTCPHLTRSELKELAGRDILDVDIDDYRRVP